jgi:integrase
MASIQKIGASWRVQIAIRGIRENKSFPTKREADAWAARRETEIRTVNNTPLGTRHTLLDALRKYADEVSPTKRGERWEMLRLNAFEQHALPLKKPINKIVPEDLAAWRDSRAKVVQPGTILREISLLSAVLESARREWRWIDQNPLRDVRKPKEPKHRKTLISRPQLKRMLRQMGYVKNKVRTITQAVACCLLLALRSGMRAGELCELTWDRVHDGYCKLVKTKNDTERDVPLTPKARAIIEQMRGFETELVFGLKAQTLDALFRRARERAGLSGFTFHDSRHTAATWIAGRMQSNGIAAQQAVFDLCKMFGWTKIDQALVYYNASAADIAKRIT